MAKHPTPPSPTETDDATPRVAKFLSRAGIASRREAERMIAEGRVKVDGRVLDSPAVKIEAGAQVEVDGKPVGAPDATRLWRYHKPAGLVTSARDEAGRKTVFDDLPSHLPRVLSVGRLDLNSEGLLLLTNDGALKRRLELPSTGWMRRYRVRFFGKADEASLAPLSKGLEIDGTRFQPMQVSIDHVGPNNSWVTIGLREGKNREIRRALESVGFQVNRLIRISYGPFQLGQLPVSGVEEVKRSVLRSQLGEAPPAPPKATKTRKRPPRR